MNLNISYNWLKEYVKTDKSAKDFAREISLSGPSVDKITDTKPIFENVVVGEITAMEKHPDADKLSICKVDIGKETLDIVCGASNIKPGQKVPVVLVGGKVGNFEVKKAKIRGVESSGMMCSQKELGLGEDHTGIYILPSYTKIGLPLEKVMPIEDEIFDLEVTSNRTDAMSIIGVAREAAAIMDKKFVYNESKPNLKAMKDIKLSVDVKEKKLCPRYQAIVMTDIVVDDSPLWMQQRLLSAGLRPINNLVDVTNYILLEFGQPMHVFDYDLLDGGEINVRLAKKGERILALDNKTYELTETNLVIADKKNPVAVAGVMGGELTSASDKTKTIVLESANFDPVSIRKTSRLLNLQSESSSLFEKGLAPENTYPALMRAIELVVELAGGKVSSRIYDEKSYKDDLKEIELNVDNVKKILGVDIKIERIKEILENLGFMIITGKKIIVKVPWWRSNDIEGEHDLIEEIARIYGYHNLPSVLPDTEIPVDLNDDDNFTAEGKVKNILMAIGFDEVYNYSFVSEKFIKNCSLDIKDHIQIANPLSTDLEYMRTSLVPGIISVFAENEGNFRNAKIFELSNIYLSQKDDIADEKLSLCLAVNSKSFEESFSEAKGAVEEFLSRINVTEVDLLPAKSFSKYWQKDRVLEIKSANEVIGYIGEINSEILHLFGVKGKLAVVEFDFNKLVKVKSSGPVYQPLSKFPGIDLDISMEIKEGVYYKNVVDTIKDVDDLIKYILFLSEYQGKGVDVGKKSLAIRVHYRHDEKTLELSEVQKIHKRVVEKLKKEYNISIR